MGELWFWEPAKCVMEGDPGRLEVFEAVGLSEGHFQLVVQP